MNQRPCYIHSASAVSCQLPLDESWMEQPLRHDGNYIRAVEPNVKDVLTPGEARRTGRLLKRAVAVSTDALRLAGIDKPDCIITATGSGCMENSEQFLIEMSRYGEQMLKPSLFMQSTHNTISSLIAIRLGCHGYNNTFSNLGFSFENALLDATLQAEFGRSDKILVGSHDEVIPISGKLMRHLHRKCTLVSEASVAFTVTPEPDNAICRIDRVTLRTGSSPSEAAAMLSADAPGLIIDGRDGDPESDAPYTEILNLTSIPSVTFKDVFGENYSASAIACYIAVTILRLGSLPEFFRSHVSTVPSKISILNTDVRGNFSIITLSK